uniref:Uncharacterized protein n=1 Tax=Arundo donax TaxID=35708 RepID=A0A0A9BMN8_ARUDO
MSSSCDIQKSCCLNFWRYTVYYSASLQDMIVKTSLFVTSQHINKLGLPLIAFG